MGFGSLSCSPPTNNSLENNHVEHPKAHRRSRRNGGQQGRRRCARVAGERSIQGACALTRDPAKYSQLADEVVLADLNRPETLKAAFAGAHGVFLVTNAWEPGTDERKQARAAVFAAKGAGVKHFIWSTLPTVETISRGTIDVAHFTDKANIDQIVRDAGFAHHTFVIAPFFLSKTLLGAMPAQKQADGTFGWALPLDPERRVIHMGDITELGAIVAGAFAQPEVAGNGETLPLVGDFLSFNEIIATLNRQGNKFAFKQVPREVFAGWFPGADHIAAMLAYFEAHTYLGSDSRDAIALANRVAGRQPTKFAAWARGKLCGPGNSVNRAPWRPTSKTAPRCACGGTKICFDLKTCFRTDPTYLSTRSFLCASPPTLPPFYRCCSLPLPAAMSIKSP